MIKVALVRGSHLNNFECQNYLFNKRVIQLTGISSKRSIHRSFPFPVITLPSLYDLNSFLVINRSVYLQKINKYVCNRTIGDSQILFGLEQYADKFDIFHTADPHYYYSYQLAKLRAQGKIKRLISTSWETIPFNNETAPAKKRIKYFTMKHTDLFLCYTDRSKHSFLKEGVEENRIQVIRLGVDLKKFKPRKIQENKILTILFAGRLVEEKGILELYEAYKKIRKTSKIQIKLNIVGDGPLKVQMQKMIHFDNFSQDITIETFPYEKISEVYSDADMFVLPSKTTKTWEEQYGMVLVEAMASAIPIVAYRSGAICEIVGNAALMVEEGNINVLTGSIIRLVKSYDLRCKLGTMGRERAETLFDAKKTALKIQHLYDHFCSNYSQK